MRLEGGLEPLGAAAHIRRRDASVGCSRRVYLFPTKNNTQNQVSVFQHMRLPALFETYVKPQCYSSTNNGSFVVVWRRISR